jgi:tetratricopeptide (TPR) repeat protein
VKVASVLESRTFALTELILVVLGIAAGLVFPRYLGLIILLICLPLFLRLVLGKFSIQRTNFDIWVALFLLTAIVGIWVAYNQRYAIQKFLFILGAIGLFYAIARQPKKNLWIIIAGMGGIGGLITALFYLTQDLSRFPADLDFVNQVNQKWMEIRPAINAESIVDDRFVNPNIIGGIAALLVPISLAITIKSWKRSQKRQAVFMFILAIFNSLVLFVSSSRAAWFAMLAGLFIWILLNSKAFKNIILQRSYLLTVFVLFVIVFGALAPSIIGNRLISTLSDPYQSAPSFISRLGIAKDTIYLLADFPFTGGGLGSFAGLYSQYILVIPYFMFSYSHNLYLDIALEQGILGLIFWIIITVLVAENVRFELFHRVKHNRDIIVESSIYASLMIVLFHGIADDSIYSYTWGLPFFFLLPGLSFVILKGKKRPSLVAAKPILVLPGFAALAAILLVFRTPIIASWDANLGAISMSKVELANWPTGSWATGSNSLDLTKSESFFLDARDYQPMNSTANYRLGLLEVHRGDFQTASNYLEASFTSKPNHRGIIKSLGYCYTWLGEYNKAADLLVQIPEAKEEMQNYIWWWQTQNRSDLAEHASIMAEFLSSEE